MEVSREKQHQKERKKERRSTKTVNLEDTNRYQHWEMRATFIGAMMHYNPQDYNRYEYCGRSRKMV